MQSEKTNRNIEKEVLQGANLPDAKRTCKNQKGVITLNNRGNTSYKWELKTYGWE